MDDLRLILYKNHNISVNINPREMILLSLDSSHQGESNRKKITEIESLDTKIIDHEVLYSLL